MSTFTEVFERKEVKYQLDAHQYQAMLSALSGRMAPDAFGLSRVISLYLDTPDRLLIERSLCKPLYKEKLRIRSYGVPAPDDRVYLEIKKKFKGVVYKRRVGCSYAAARAYTNGMPYEQACRSYPLPDPVMAAESVAPRSIQIAREIDWFILRYQPLLPSMLIECERTAYVSCNKEMSGGSSARESETGFLPGVPVEAQSSVEPNLGGVADVSCDNLRITFDKSITYRDLCAASPSIATQHISHSGGALLPEQAVALLGEGHVIMEIKVAGPYPLWLVRALDACEAYPTSFSKYGEAYKTCQKTAIGVRVRARVPVSAGAVAIEGVPRTVAVAEGVPRTVAVAGKMLNNVAAVSRRLSRPVGAGVHTTGGCYAPATCVDASGPVARLAVSARDAHPRRVSAPQHAQKKEGRYA